MDRREFIKFLGLGSLSLAGCSLQKPSGKLASSTVSENLSATNFIPINPSSEDKLILPQGYSYDVLIAWGDQINEREFFGFNNDFTMPFWQGEQNLLWVNHESVDPRFIPEEAEQRKAVGGSIIAIEKKDTKWKFAESKLNRRIDANTPMQFTGPLAQKQKDVIGTLANCSGGKTPWNTVLSCEENFHNFDSKYGWENFKRKDYGWVVEVDPFDPDFVPKKHSSLGRFAHENAAIVSQEKAVVVYMGDDKADEHIYKFISDSGDLENGKLYVAKMHSKDSGSWELLHVSNAKLQKQFQDQADLLIKTRRAAKLLGASPLNRPEDLEISPVDGSVFVSLTQNFTKGDFHGSILKITQESHTSLDFKYQNFLMGGADIGLSAPDNLCFDNKGNLWVTTDIKGAMLNKTPYSYHGNNSLFMVPSQGELKGQALRFASAPSGAELTGPSFDRDFETLFLSVQHPGEFPNKSTWPFGEPKSGVVSVQLL